MPDFKKAKSWDSEWDNKADAEFTMAEDDNLDEEDEDEEMTEEEGEETEEIGEEKEGGGEEY